MHLVSALEEVAPFAAIIEADGACRHIGRSLRKVCEIPDGAFFFDAFEVVKPFALRGVRSLEQAAGKRVTLQARRSTNGAPINLRASIAPLDSAGAAFLVLASLGTELPSLVAALKLNDSDFSYADPSVDMLYLLRTQAGLLKDTQALAERLQHAKDAAEALAYSDSLTGLPNRRALSDYTAALMSGDSARDGPAFLLHVDLDRFKQVNDTLGHAAGDAILKRVASDLRDAAEPGDIVARIGGDEFILILCTPPDLAAAVAVGTRLIERISMPLDVNGQQAQVGASIGIASIPEGSSKSVDTLLIEADLALYDVKNAGRGSVKAFSSALQDREALTQQLIRDIEPAITAGEFVPYFQIQVDYASGQVYGVEVLGRWEHPRFGMVLPQQFLYVAERAQLTEKIDCAIYEKALSHLAEWQAQGIAPPHLSFNITARKLVSPGFVDRFLGRIRRHGLHPSQIVFELVETILLDGEADDVRQAAVELHEAGFALAIDDFGTGRASLTSLISVPVDIVKIDRAFIANLQDDPRRALLTEAIVNIARALDLQVLAEGAEVRAECDLLLELGCSVFQGFFFGKAIPAQAFAETLRDAAWPTALPSKGGAAAAPQEHYPHSTIRRA